jgi:hypothetical protein
MSDNSKSDFSNEGDIMDVLAQHFPPPPKSRSSDDLPTVMNGETVTAANDSPTTSEVSESVASSKPPNSLLKKTASDGQR